MRMLGIITVLLFLVSCRDEAPQFVNNNVRGGALGTSYSITYLSPESRSFEHEIDSVFNVINQSLSTYIPNSDISKINTGDSTVVIDHMFREVFLLSKQVYESTDGYFDPTVGTLVNAWGLARENR